MQKHQSFVKHPRYEEKHIFILVRCPYLRQGLMTLCELYAGWRICGLPENIKELKLMLQKHPVDLVITDTDQAQRDICSLLTLPAFVEGRRLLLTHQPSFAFDNIYRAAGFDAVVSKRMRLSLLNTLLYQLVNSGQDERGEEFTRRLYPARERKMLLSLLQGEKLKDIALKMNVSHSTACRMKKNILARAGVKNMKEMVLGHTKAA